MSFIFANGLFGVGFFNASTKYLAARVAASADKTLDILIFEGGIPQHQKLSLILFMSQILSNN